MTERRDTPSHDCIEVSLQRVIASLSANRCYACGWPLGSCKPFDCGMRYRDDTQHLAEKENWHKRAQEMARVLKWGVATSTEALTMQSERGEWIAVTERLPTHVYSVLIRVTGGMYHHDEDYTEIGIYLNGIWRHEADGDDMPIMVSHWMPLPEAPHG